MEATCAFSEKVFEKVFFVWIAALAVSENCSDFYFEDVRVPTQFSKANSMTFDDFSMTFSMTFPDICYTFSMRV